MLKNAVFTIFLALDLASYCKGLCNNRYADGDYSPQHKMCECIDYYSVHIDQKLEVPKKIKKEFDDPKVYYGVDQMHYPLPEPEF